MNCVSEVMRSIRSLCDESFCGVELVDVSIFCENSQLMKLNDVLDELESGSDVLEYQRGLTSRRRNKNAPMLSMPLHPLRILFPQFDVKESVLHSLSDRMCLLQQYLHNLHQCTAYTVDDCRVNLVRHLVMYAEEYLSLMQADHRLHALWVMAAGEDESAYYLVALSAMDHDNGLMVVQDSIIEMKNNRRRKTSTHAADELLLSCLEKLAVELPVIDKQRLKWVGACGVDAGEYANEMLQIEEAYLEKVYVGNNKYMSYSKQQLVQQRCMRSVDEVKLSMLNVVMRVDDHFRLMELQTDGEYKEVNTASAILNVIESNEVEIAKRLSTTASSSVYCGKYRGTDVAIKMLREDGVMQISDTGMREIEILSNLRHPRIVSLLGVILDLENRTQIVGLVTEFMSRGCLYDVLHLNVIPPEHRLSTLSSKLRVLRDVADGMRFLHMSNVIHRDLKSPNVLLDDDGRAKIFDFGISKLLSSSVTHACAGGAGTPAWQAPESLLEETDTACKSSDVYSFGVILWEMLTNNIPWKDFPDNAIIVRVSRGESLPLDAVAFIADTPPELVVMMEQCLSRNPEHRPTFEHIVQCLSDVLPACIAREGRVPCPNAYLCPISYEIMEDPVICSDGHTYDRVNIERWLQHNDTSPLTNMILEDKKLRPNIALKGMIQEFKEKNL